MATASKLISNPLIYVIGYLSYQNSFGECICLSEKEKRIFF